MTYTIRQDGKDSGPFTLERLREMRAEGSVGPLTMFRRAGGDVWLSYVDVQAELEANGEQIPPDEIEAVPPPLPLGIDAQKEPARYLKIAGEKVGPYEIKQIYRLWEQGKVDRTTPMWLESRGEWGMVADVPEEMFGYPSEDRLRDIASSGIEFVEILTAGDDRDCPVCMAVRGLKFPVAQALPIPLPCCTCQPWNRCVYIAVEA